MARVVGRYELHDPIATGGMATVHFGRMKGAVGFARTVAIKCLHPGLAADPNVVKMFIDEARLAARIQHPNVASVLDVVEEGPDLFLIMEYVHGESLSRLERMLARRSERMPVPIAVSILAGVLAGLEAAHSASSETGEPLNIVHRDVSPQNVLVGADGVARLVDFGVAKAESQVHFTKDGHTRGKAAYMAPEQVRGEKVTPRTDVFATGIVLWESLTGQRLFEGENDVARAMAVMTQPIDAPGIHVPAIPEALDAVVMRALERDPARRYASAREMAVALEHAVRAAPATEVSAWIREVASGAFEARAAQIRQIESRTSEVPPAPRSALQERTVPLAATPTAIEPVVATKDAVAITQPPRGANKSSSAGTVALAFVFIALLGGVLWVTRGRGAPIATGATPTTSTSAAPVTTPSAPPPVEAPRTQPTVSAAPPVATTRAQPTPRQPKSQPVRPPATPMVTATAAPPAKNCNPPYDTDSAGRRMFKPECL